MTAEAVQWSYALAPEVRVEPGVGGAVLRTPTTEARIEGAVEIEALKLLDGTGLSEPDLHTRLRSIDPDDEIETRCAALLFQLDTLGLLARTLCSGERQLVSCVPLRPGSGAPPDRPPEGLLRLSCHALARVDGNLITLEKPGAHARLMFHDRDLLPLLHDLSFGRPATAMSTAVPGMPAEAILSVLALVSWCELLDGDDEARWSTHDLLFHARTRRGYARVVLGKADLSGERAAHVEQEAVDAGRVRIPLEPPDWIRLLVDDPPHALVSNRRRSVRLQGSHPITSKQLSEFLFRTLHEFGGRRPYPSGGGCYPLNAYIAIHRCRGIASGLYFYAPTRHELVAVSEAGTGLERLLADAAAAANVDRLPQILIVLAARFDRTGLLYRDLSYSLILKEVGGVFQTAMMAAAAMGLAACPLGCGNSLELSELAGTNPLVETSVGEMILGSLDETSYSGRLEWAPE
jgi:oxazoline/thiazoline dehydrogenase